MKFRFLVRKTHKWLALIISIQVLIWMVSGLYMTIVGIDLVHGDHLVKTVTATATALPDKTIAPLPGKAFQRYGNVSEITLTRRLNKAVYLLTTEDGKIVLDAANGNILGELEQDEVIRLAQQHYAGSSNMLQARRLEQYPDEIGGRSSPVWRVSYDDWSHSMLYFDTNSGELIRKRSDLWRWFDFFWMLHIMDYETRDNVNTTLLRIATSLGGIMALSGLMLVVYRFRKKGNQQ